MERVNNKDKIALKKDTSVMRRSIVVVFLVILVLCGILIGRLVYLNNVKGDVYAKAVLSQQAYSSTVIKSKRGMITDRNGIVLAKSDTMYNVVIDPAVILSKYYFYKPTMKALTEVLGYDSEEMETLIRENSGSSYVVYERDIDYSRVSAFNAYKNSTKFVVGVWFEEEYERKYPYGDLASHVLGFTTSADEGTYGLEQYYNDELNGTDGLSYGYYDAELNIQKNVKDAVDGHDLQTTLDSNVQRVVQNKVKEFLDETGANNIGVIVMNPNNAEILAMASNYEYDLNNPRSLTGIIPEVELEQMSDEEKINKLYKIWRNFCISDTYEPGSTFKTITVASALEEDYIMPGDSFDCPGYRQVGGWTIYCNKKTGHGSLSLAQSLMKSCNCALMTIADKLGRDYFYEYETRFGFGQRTGVDLTGEATGMLIPVNKLNETELATSSFGTTFTVNMMQIAAAYASIVNGGTYYKPHVVKKILNGDGTVRKEFDSMTVRQTVSEDTAKFIRGALYNTVEAGTATPAKVAGYLIGGKTGTAQKRPRTEKKYVVSFCGFAPVEKPQVLVYIVIDEIHDEALSASSSSATKMSAAIMKEILPYLGIYPEGDIEYNVDYSIVEDFERLGLEELEEDLDVIPEGIDAQD